MKPTPSPDPKPEPESPGRGDASWRGVDELFHAAMKKPAAERESWLDGQTAAGDDVRDEVRSLLAALSAHEELSKRRLAQPPENQTKPVPAATSVPTAQFGAYRAVELIGRGWRGAGEAGLLRGAYHFFHPTVPAAAQAESFIRSVVRLEPGDLPPVLDLEVPAAWGTIAQSARAPLAI